MNISVIGAGRVGTTIAYILAKKNIKDLQIKSIASKTGKSLNRAKKILGELGREIFYTTDNIEASLVCDCIFICTPDDLIGEACNQIFKALKRRGINARTLTVIHFSGAKSLKVLESARESGAAVASIHPLKSFASIEDSIKTIGGTIFGITYESRKAKLAAIKIVKSLGGKIIEIEDDKKPLYHAAACVASNYLVSLINYAVEIHKSIGIKPEDSLEGLMNLIEGTVSNIGKLGTKKSLTGPVARGDVQTLKEHLENFKRYLAKDKVFLYKVLGSETSKIAYDNGWISKETLDSFKKIFKS